ncbi:phage tail length tape measure family protein [Rhodanobacter sp. DHB23]|uniref:phage tail length tape measure family protein n=1 Tax=Rhodanobacter sp. DHB23 TaxID=2775923 RepID=UPI00177B4783|nr:phage tail length tape measure family protein [Rhodanobacter sp. DHB23]MBD8873872.1 phage tail length tape measure family protein [Rhodanobacter sp. DHB23]
MASTDDEIKVLLTSDASQLQAGMEAGAESVEEATEAMQATVAQEAAAFNDAVQTKIAAMTRLNTAMAGNLGSSEGMAEAESALDAAMASGAVTASEYAAALDTLNAAEVSTAAATEASSAAFALSGGTARELGVLIGEALRGNYTRLEGSTITLANRTGLLQQVFSPTGVAIMATAGAALYLGDQLLKADETASAFNRAILSTGDIVGMTSGELNGLAMQVGTFTGQTSQADVIVQKLAQSGKLTGQSLQYAAQAAANSMQLTGESADQAAREVESLAGNPTQAVVALNDKYHFLTVELYEQISTLQREGDTFGATEVAAKAFADNTSDRLDNLNSKMGFFERQLSDFKNGFNVIDQGLRKAFDPTLEEQSAAATVKAYDAQQQLNAAIKAYGNIGGDDAKQAIENARQYAEETKKASDALRAQVKAQQDAAQHQAKAAQQNAQLIQEVKEQDDLNQHLKETSLLQEKIAEAKQRIEDIHKSDPNSESIKGISFDASGAIAGGEQWAAILTKLQHEFGETKAKAVDLHKSLEEQLDIDESTDQVSYQNREKYELAFWTQKLATLKKGTLQYAEAYRTIQQLTKEVDDERAQEAKKADEEELASLEKTVTAAENGAEQKRRSNEEAFRAGTVSAQQYLATEKAIDQELLAAYAQYIAKKEELDKGNVKALQDDAKLWSTEQTRVSDDVANAQAQAAAKTQQAWNQATNQITRSMVQGFDQIIFKSGTTNQTLAQQAEQAAGRIIESMVNQVLEKWIAAEMKKLASSVQTLLGIGTANDTQATTDIATDATKSAAMVANAIGVAGAQGVASFAGAPWPVDMGAPAFGAAMAAAAGSFAVASAAGGWDRVPFDGAQAILHKDEMVLPSHIAGPMRQIAQSGLAGGAGNTHHWHINANDAQSVTKLIRNDPGGLIKAANRAARFQRNR